MTIYIKFLYEVFPPNYMHRRAWEASDINNCC